MRDAAVLDRRYRIEQKLAAGGFGAIYRATDLVMGREVALKVLHSELADDSAVVERFRREAGALARLRDPHTITMYDVGLSADGTRYIVMELLRGESLYALFTAKGRLPWQRVIAIARGVCSSLREAHALQIVHRDLKPANIHLEHHALEHDYVKVLDFGIAKVLDNSDPDQPELTLAGQLIGTFDYMSPEQMLGGSCTDRSDVFALAVIVYEMIAGVRPYGEDANGPASMLMSLLGTEPAPLSTHVDDVPPALDRVIMRALAQDPKERLDISAFDDTLARILDEARDLALGTTDIPLAAGPPVQSRTTSRANERDANDRDAAEAWFRADDEATWIDQLPRRDTPTSHRTLIGTLAPMQTPPLGVPQVQRKTPLRGTPPPELLERATGSARPAPSPHPTPSAKSIAEGTATDAQPMRRTPLRGTPPMGRPRDATSPARVTPARGTTPLPPRGMKTSSSSEDFTRVETPRGASGASRPRAKRAPVSPLSQTVSIEQAIAEEVDEAVDGLLGMALDSQQANDSQQPNDSQSDSQQPNDSQVPSHGAQVLLPRPGSPAHAGIWPAPERVRPLTVRFAVGSGTELPSLEAAPVSGSSSGRSLSGPSLSGPWSGGAMSGRSSSPSLSGGRSPSTVRSERRLPAGLRYVLWTAVLFGVGFAAALGIGAL